MVNKEAWCRYRQQKMRLAGLIREQIRIYEENVVEKIKRNGRNGGLWDNINKLRGKEVKRGKFALCSVRWGWRKIGGGRCEKGNEQILGRNI